MHELTRAFIRNLDSRQYNKTQLAADAIRVLGPAVASYFIGYGAEIAATAACGPGLGPMIVGSVVRTHVSGIYQLDIHRAFIGWLREKCGLTEAEAQQLINDDVIDRQPGPVSTEPAAPPASCGEKTATLCERIATKGFPAIATGFALGGMPAMFSHAQHASTAATIVGKALQACAPSFFGTCISKQEASLAPHDTRRLGR